MTRRIRRDDPAYEAAMAEAKAQFDVAMARGVMRGRNRPSQPVTPDAAAPVDATDETPAAAPDEG